MSFVLGTVLCRGLHRKGYLYFRPRLREGGRKWGFSRTTMSLWGVFNIQWITTVTTQSVSTREPGRGGRRVDGDRRDHRRLYETSSQKGLSRPRHWDHGEGSTRKPTVSSRPGCKILRWSSRLKFGVVFVGRHSPVLSRFRTYRKRRSSSTEEIPSVVGFSKRKETPLTPIESVGRFLD